MSNSSQSISNNELTADSIFFFRTNTKNQHSIRADCHRFNLKKRKKYVISIYYTYMHHKNGTCRLGNFICNRISYFFVTGFFTLSLSLFHPTFYININEFHADRSLWHVDKSILGVHRINDLIMYSLMIVRT